MLKFIQSYSLGGREKDECCEIIVHPAPKKALLQQWWILRWSYDSFDIMEDSLDNKTHNWLLDSKRLVWDFPLFDVVQCIPKLG